MIYLFYGEDSVSSRRYLIRFKQNYEEVVTFNENNFRLESLKEVVNNQSLFSKKYLVVLENLKKFLEIIPNIKDLAQIDLVFWIDKKIERSKIDPAIKVIEFKLTNSPSVFKLADAFGLKKTEIALRFFENIWEKTEPEIIVGTLTRQLRLLLIYKSGSFEKIQVSPFMKDKIKEQELNWEIDDLEEAVTKLFNMDYALKQSKIEPKLALTLFLNTFIA